MGVARICRVSSPFSSTSERNKNADHHVVIRQVRRRGNVRCAGLGALLLHRKDPAGERRTEDDSLGGKFAGDVKNAANQLPGQLGNALASSIFQKPKQGQSKGDEIGDAMAKALKNAGVHLLGSVFTSMGKQIIESSVVQHVLDRLTQWAVHYSSNPGNVFAGGTDYAPGGQAVVGEHGRELVNLPRGSQVIPNSKTEDLLRQYSADGMGRYATPGLGAFPSPSAMMPVGGGSSASPSGSTTVHGHTIHAINIYESSNGREMARNLANYLGSALGTTAFSK